MIDNKQNIEASSPQIVSIIKDNLYARATNFVVFGLFIV